MLTPRDPSQSERYNGLKVKGWKKIFHSNEKKKKLGQQYLYPTK